VRGEPNNCVYGMCVVCVCGVCVYVYVVCVCVCVVYGYVCVCACMRVWCVMEERDRRIEQIHHCSIINNSNNFKYSSSTTQHIHWKPNCSPSPPRGSVGFLGFRTPWRSWEYIVQGIYEQVYAKGRHKGAPPA